MGHESYFEMMSGLKVNFHKNNFIGINVDGNFKVAAARFLTYMCGILPFKYLGLPVGADPKSLLTWKPVLDSVQKRLSSWKRRHLYLGGRITLINVVLNSIPVYYLSFPKLPKKVLKN